MCIRDSPGTARPVQGLNDQVDRFESLLADLLEISRYDAGPITLETEPTNLVVLAEEVVEGLRPLSPGIIEPVSYTHLDVYKRQHVQRLRAKIERDPDHPTIVSTVRGVGYRAGAPTE